jgi:single-strand DNA-binding protein
MANLNFNRVILGGRLTGDPETKTTNSGAGLCVFNIAINRPKKDGQDQQADFLRCLAWEKTAQFVQQYFRKGSSILIEGRIQTGSYTDRDGNKRYSTDIVCERASFVDSRAEESRSHTAVVGAYQPMPEGADMQPVDDNLPF